MFTCVNLILLKISVVSNFSWIKNTHENFNLKNFQKYGRSKCGFSTAYLLLNHSRFFTLAFL